MRYAIFSDIHANLEALEAVLAKIDELAQEEPIEQIWFLGDLVGYGPDPNECILKLRERTDIIIAGNHDWAAVGKIDLEDFSAAARISAEWTAEQLTEEHRTFLTNLPERIEKDECTLVHGSPYGPLWEYLTSEVLAERSFQYFSSRYCLVGHTHVPVIFQQPDSFSNAPTLPLQSEEPIKVLHGSNGVEHHIDEDNEETEEIVAVQIPIQQATHSATVNGAADSAFREPKSADQFEVEDGAHVPDAGVTLVEEHAEITTNGLIPVDVEEITSESEDDSGTKEDAIEEKSVALPVDADMELEKPDVVTFESGDDEHTNTGELEDGSIPVSANVAIDEVDEDESIKILHNEDTLHDDRNEQVIIAASEDFDKDAVDANVLEDISSQNPIENDEEDLDMLEISLEAMVAEADDQLSGEIEELLTLLGLSQSMIQVTNEMITPPEGLWKADEGYRAIINPGGVGQPRDGDPRAAFMIYDTERGFEFYRIPYEFEKTQEKIIKAGLPQYLAVRLEYGR